MEGQGISPGQVSGQVFIFDGRAGAKAGRLSEREIGVEMDRLRGALGPARRPMASGDLKQVEEWVAQDLRKDTNAASAYRIGVLAWQSGRIGDAHGWITKAAAMDAENLEILWALGVLHVLPDQDLKTGEAGALKTMSLRDRLAKAKESMDRFVKLSKPSWWLLKAQDHLRKINELQGQMAR